MQVLPGLSDCSATVWELRVGEKMEWIVGIEMQVGKSVNKTLSLKHSICWGWLTYFQGF